MEEGEVGLLAVEGELKILVAEEAEREIRGEEEGEKAVCRKDQEGGVVKSAHSDHL